MSVRERIDIKSTGGRTEIHVKRPAGVTARVIGFKVEADNLFSAGSGATQSRAMRISGDRAAANVMGGDAHDFLLELAYTNEAVNTPAGSYARGLSIGMTNDDSGEIGSLQGALISVKNKGDAGEASEMRAIRADVTHDVGGDVSTGWVEGLRVNIKIHAVGPTPSATAGTAGITVNNDATGDYANKPVAYSVRTIGQKFSYGFSCYDETTRVVDDAEIRFAVQGSGGPCVLASGTASSSAAIITQIGAVSDGSAYIEVSDSGGEWWIKKSGTFQTVNT